MCLIPFIYKNNCSNLSLVKFDPLSLTSFSGSPCVAKTILSFSVVAVEDEVFTRKTSIHLVLSFYKVPDVCHEAHG